MTYSIIDTRDISGETISTHRTLEAAQRAWCKRAYRRERADGKMQTRETGATRDLRIRNDATGRWASDEDKIAPVLPCDAVELRDLLVHGGYSQASGAVALEISPRMMRYYVSGDKPVPRVVMLAMRHLVTCPPRE